MKLEIANESELLMDHKCWATDHVRQLLSLPGFSLRIASRNSSCISILHSHSFSPIRTTLKGVYQGNCFRERFRNVQNSSDCHWLLARLLVNESDFDVKKLATVSEFQPSEF